MIVDVSDLTLRQIRELQALMPTALPPAPSSGPTGALPAHPYPMGEAVFIRTVTMNFTGRISAVFPGEIVLEDAAWIADSGRFAEALATGKLSEVEPYPGSVIIGRGAIVDVSRWAHPLPRSVK